MIEFEIHYLPQMPNQLLGRHWRSRSRHATKWLGLVMLALQPFKPLKRAKAARLTLIRYSSNPPDFDGLCGSFKAVIDALVKCGALEDDGPEVIGQPTYRHEKISPGKGKIKVKLEVVA